MSESPDLQVALELARQAAAARGQRLQDATDAMIAAATPGVEPGVRALLRSPRFAIFMMRADTTITAADGAWYDANIPIEEIVGGRLNLWPVWPFYAQALAYLDRNPRVRAVSFELVWDVDGASFDVVLARHGSGFVVLTRTQTHHLGRIS